MEKRINLQYTGVYRRYFILKCVVLQMERSLQHLQNAVRALVPKAGSAPTGIPMLTAYRFTAGKIRMPQPHNPYVYFVLDGTLRLHTPSGIMDYAPGQYSISQIDTPLSGQVLTVSEHGDFLALALEFTANEVIASVLEIDNDLIEKITNETLTEQAMSQSDHALIEAGCRLLSVKSQAHPSEFMRKNIMREMIYHILCGACGKQFLQSVANIGQADEIYAANSWIKENFRNSFTVEALAEQWNMSVSLFHQKFKNAVGMGPLQCQKRLRLTEARKLMLDEKKNVTEAAIAVEYESVSQFVRDYKKMFGAAPKADILNIRRYLKKQANFSED